MKIEKRTVVFLWCSFRPWEYTRALAQTDPVGALCITRKQLLAAARRLHCLEYYVRTSSDVYAQGGKDCGKQWYNLKDGVRPLAQ